MEKSSTESQLNARYVYVQTTPYLWRFDFEAIDSKVKEELSYGNYRKHLLSGKADDFYAVSNTRKGVLTRLIDFRKEQVPLGAGGFVFDSKLFFVGGETVKTDTPHIKLLPRGSFDDDDEFNSFYNMSIRRLEVYHDSEGYLKLPRSALNKRVFVLDQFFDSKPQPIVPSISTLNECESQAPKTRPFVIPIKKEDRTLIYVLSQTPLFYKHTVPKPSFEVFYPAHNSWEKLEEPPFWSCAFLAESAFEFRGMIVVASRDEEMCFDPHTKKWQHSDLFGLSYEGDMPSCVINVFGDLYLGCRDRVVWAYQLGPNNRVRIQPLDIRCETCSNSTLCNLGDGHVLFVSTCYRRPNLHFGFIKFQMYLYEESPPFANKNQQPLPIVGISHIEYLRKRVKYVKTPLLDYNSFLHAYVL